VVLAHEFSQTIWLVSLIPFFLINNLLLLNQYPDIKADTSVGRKTFPIAFGINMSNIVYLVSMLAAFLLIVLLIMTEKLPSLSYIALLPLVLSVYSFIGAVKFKSAIGEHPKHLAANVMAAIFTPLLLAISIFIY
jgi:1,4-dihydroxy-2-naphthoate octaprenyltransferase